MGAEERSWDLAADMEAVAGDADSAVVQIVPSSSISVDPSLPLPLMAPRLVELCKDLFKEWAHLDDSDFSVDTVSGGITNQLMKVTVRGSEGINCTSVTVRLYGPNTDLVIDRKRELQAIPYLSASGFGATLLGTFRNGMVQSFIHARTLEPADMRDPSIAVEIAKELRRFHQVSIPGQKDPRLWSDISKFLKKAEALEFDDDEKQSKYKSISFEEILEEINGLKDLTSRLKAPVVFAHNDLLSGNLMKNDTTGKIYFIDFEYGSYSYRGYDIANHFNEYAGFDCDYNLYPEKDAQYLFFRSYLEPDDPAKVSSIELESLYVETNTFRLASHLYWALWALIQAKVSPINFDYFKYFSLRYNEFRRLKDSSLACARNFLLA